MSQTNTAALITLSTEPNQFVTVGEAPFHKPTADQILVKSVAFAVNPTDWKHVAFGLSKKNAIAGSDVSGVVEEVGSNVKGFAKGDYVSSFIHGNSSTERGAFVKYAVADPQVTVKYGKFSSDEALKVGEYPSGVIDTFEGAASVTLGLATVGLSFAGNLQISPSKSDNADKYILIWGGATATGILAIQVAKYIYGLKVITTASPKNHEFLKSLGADETFNYRDESSLKELTKFDISYALDTVSTKETFPSVYAATKGSKHVKIDNLLFLGEKDVEVDASRPGKTEFVPPTLAYAAVGYKVEAYGTTWDLDAATFGRYKQFWFELLPELVPKLKHANLRVLKQGFESTNEGFQLLKDDKVSAEKVVFRA